MERISGALVFSRMRGCSEIISSASHVYVDAVQCCNYYKNVISYLALTLFIEKGLLDSLGFLQPLPTWELSGLGIEVWHCTIHM